MVLEYDITLVSCSKFAETMELVFVVQTALVLNSIKSVELNSARYKRYESVEVNSPLPHFLRY